MKLTFLFALLVVVCLTHDTDALFFRKIGRAIGRAVKKVGGAIKKGACWACPRVCRNGVCKVVCKKVCGRRKREAVQGMAGHVTPLANQFAAYDLNDDGLVDRKELSAAIGELESHPDFIKAYSIADINGDELLSAKELYNGPFVFEMDMNDNDLQYCRYRMDIDDDLEDIVQGAAEIQGPSFIAGEQVKDTGKAAEIPLKQKVL